MKPYQPKRHKDGPEAAIEDKIITRLRKEGWFVKKTIGNANTQGWPDLYATHYRYKQRWIEVKRPNMEGSKFTPAQLEDFPKFCANGSGIWILTGATDEEFKKLELPCNWMFYLMKGRW